MNSSEKFLDSYGHDLNFFQLACVFSVPIGLPAVLIGELLSMKFGAGIAVGSILAGNLILWVTGMAMISMAYQDRTNAIENARKYISRYGEVAFALVLVIVFLNWFVLIIDYSITILMNLMQDGNWGNGTFVRIGAGMGLFTALLSIGGMKLIKWLTTWGLLFVLAYHLYGAFVSGQPEERFDSWGVTSSGVITSVLMLFPGVINLPTVFRHSKSRIDSFLSLSLIFILVSFFEISFIWMPFDINFGVNYVGNSFAFFGVVTAIFVVFKLICSNLLNIYFASACWELFFPKFEGAKGYAIIGLLGTAAYTFIQITHPIIYIRDLTNCFLISLGVVLVIGFLIQLIVRHRPRNFEKSINVASWFVGCVASSVSLFLSSDHGVISCWVGIAASVLFFLVVLFIEETVWALKKMIFEKKKNE